MSSLGCRESTPAFVAASRMALRCAAFAVSASDCFFRRSSRSSASLRSSLSCNSFRVVTSLVASPCLLCSLTCAPPFNLRFFPWQIFSFLPDAVFCSCLPVFWSCCFGLPSSTAWPCLLTSQSAASMSKVAVLLALSGSQFCFSCLITGWSKPRKYCAGIVFRNASMRAIRSRICIIAGSSTAPFVASFSPPAFFLCLYCIPGKRAGSPAPREVTHG
mmetsp:Transcript_72675/g.168381  ORF Transcript_72675/g.168381 Transcript_72675/m.168381 type:complete len:217 (-) Transcript_72675:22-672(-)